MSVQVLQCVDGGDNNNYWYRVRELLIRLSTFCKFFSPISQQYSKVLLFIPILHVQSTERISICPNYTATISTQSTLDIHQRIFRNSYYVRGYKAEYEMVLRSTFGLSGKILLFLLAVLLWLLLQHLLLVTSLGTPWRQEACIGHCISHWTNHSCKRTDSWDTFVGELFIYLFWWIAYLKTYSFKYFIHVSL